MSYAGMGLTLSTPTMTPPTLSLSTAPKAPSPTATPNMVDVGIDPAVVSALSSLMNTVWTSSARTTDMAPIYLAGVLLGRAKPNAFGKIDASAVMTALNVLPAALQSFMTVAIRNYNVPALRGITIAGLIADITAGKYAGHPATLALAPVRLAPMTIIPLKTGAAPVVPATPAPTPAADVQCTDGYFRDASGLCQPNAAAPGPTAPPDGAAPDQPMTPSVYTPSLPAEALPLPASPTTGGRLLGVSWKWWAAGAVSAIAAGVAYRTLHKTVTPNKRRKRR